MIIPCRNSAKTLEACLTSIFNAQSEANIKNRIIVVIDRCRDRTRNIAEKFSVEVVLSKSPGRSAARNTGASLSTTPYLCFFDSDCILDPNFFKHLITLTNSTSYDLIQASIVPAALGRSSAYYEKCWTNYFEASSGTFNFFEIEHRKTIPNCDSAGICIKRSSFQNVGGFDEKLIRFEDRDICNRLYLTGGHLKAGLPLFVYKIFQDKLFFTLLKEEVETALSIGRSKSYIPSHDQVFHEEKAFVNLLLFIKRFFQGFIAPRKIRTREKKLFSPLRVVRHLLLFIPSLKFQLNYEAEVLRKLRAIDIPVETINNLRLGRLENSFQICSFNPFLPDHSDEH